MKINKCSYCASGNLIKFGRRSTRSGKKQIYLCKTCGRKFTRNDGFLRMRYRKEVITAALDLYAKGLSLRQVSDHIKQFYQAKVSQSTVLEWVHKYTRIIRQYTDNLKLDDCRLLHADETVFRFNGHKNWFWACIDGRSRYFIGFELTRWRWGKDSKILFEKSRKSLACEPKAVMTDGFMGYPAAMEEVFPNSYHIVERGCADPKNNNVKIESFNRTVKDRVKAMHSFKSFRSARNTLECWRIWYNFIKGHSGLNGKTPAEAAGLFKPNGGNVWLELIKKSVRNKNYSSQTRKCSH